MAGLGASAILTSMVPIFRQLRPKTYSVLLFCLLSLRAVPGPCAESFISPAIDQKESQDSVEATIERRDALDYDPTRRSLFPDVYYKVRDWREKVFAKIGLKASLSYDVLGQGIVDQHYSEGATAGDLTLNLNWLLVGEKYTKPIYLSVQIRNRYAYSGISPQELGQLNGLLWKTVEGFNDSGFQVPSFYFSQELLDGRLTLRYGQYGADNFFDTHSLQSAKRYFLNQAFATNPTVAFPSYGTGFALQWRDTRNWDFSFGGSNIQSTNALGPKEINLSLGSSALFYALQGGINFEGLNKRDARLQCMLWDAQENSENEIPSGRGISLTLEHAGKRATERYIARLTLSEGDATSVDRLMMVGYGREIRKYDHFGVGLGVGRSLRNHSLWQTVTEVYYRWQVTKELIITPDIQAVFGQGLDHGEDFHLVAGIRAGITF